MPNINVEAWPTVSNIWRNCCSYFCNVVRSSGTLRLDTFGLSISARMLALKCTIYSTKFSTNFPRSSGWSVLKGFRSSSICFSLASSVGFSQPLSVSFKDYVCNLWTLAYIAVDLRFKRCTLFGLLAFSMAYSFNSNTEYQNARERKTANGS